MASYLLPSSLCMSVLSLIFCTMIVNAAVALTADTPPQPAAAPRITSISAAPSSEQSICVQLVIPHGYSCQDYHVKTEDGYILGLQRIWRSNLAVGQPVLVQHGLLMDASSWFMNSPWENLPMILADKGYDVWMANTRGTRSSRSHQTLTPNNPAFWSWSWDELAMHDLPANIDLIYGKTGQKVHFIGHSLGTLTALAGFSEGKAVDKVRSAVFLCPVAYLSHMTSLVGNFLIKSYLTDAISYLPIAEFNPKAMQSLVRMICDVPGVNCYDILTAITGNNCCLNKTTIDTFLQWAPQSTSMRNMIHLAQSVRSGVVAKYNYGMFFRNIQHYLTPTPPKYNLQRIPPHLPIFMTYGGRDQLSDLADVDALLHDFRWRGKDTFQTHFVETYSHMDFIMGVTAKDIVYDNVIDFLERH